MKVTTLLFYFMMFISVANTSSATSSESSVGLYSYEPKQLDYSKLVADILNELMSGFLKGRSITLLLDEDGPLNSYQSDDFLEATEQPVLLLRLPWERPKTIPRNHTYIPDLIIDDYVEYYPLTHSILVIVIGANTPSWWPLVFPPDHWHMKAVILIVLSPMCSPEHYLQTQLLERPSNVAVLCLHKSPRPSEILSFKIWSWKPYVREGHLVDLGMWTRDSFKTWDDVFIDRFDDMTTYNMSILVQWTDRPLIYILDGETEMKGTNILIMDTLRQWLKFDLKYEAYGLVFFTRIFETVMKAETDVFINYGTITYERNAKFETTAPYLMEGFGIILEIPPPLPTWQNILYPFDWWVWVAVIVTMVFVTVTYHMLNYRNEPSFITNGITTMQSLLSNPHAVVPEEWRLRNFLLVWWLASWCLNLSYTCNLIAVLTVPVMPVKLQTSEELLASDYDLCMLDYGEFLDEALAESTNPLYNGLSRKLEMVPSSETLTYFGQEHCIERLIAGTHAHTETYSFIILLYNLLGHGGQVYSFKEQLYPGYLAFFITKYAPWKYKFDEGIDQMVESGLMGKWYWDSMAVFDKYVDRTPKEVLMSLSLGHLSGPFLFYGFGILLSSIVMLAEVLLPQNLYK